MAKTLYNMHGVKRICTRCKDEDAVTRVKSEWLGPYCMQKRRERQRNTAEFVPTYCPKCGKQMSKDLELCWDCVELDNQRSSYRANVNDIKTIEDVKDFLFAIEDKFIG